MNKVKIFYLYNSGFYIETENNILIFDYYYDKVNAGDNCLENGVINLKDLKYTNKDILIFVTHSHYDHFNPIIFNFKNQLNNIKYILSSDIVTPQKEKDIYFMAPYNKLNLNDIEVLSFGSTDLGLSYLVKVDGITIFHSGDLNWWDWFDESQEYNKKMEISFKKEISKLSSHSVDIAFFPVDSRLKDSYYLGGEYFISKIRPKFFIPMHFRDDFKITKQFKDKINYNFTNIIEINKRGEQFSLSI
ncbi:MAG: MBL fold metallo-hydrolase [Clostridium sp.]|nr:MBL fold metallo-hydrolase [Clostridium sp.]